VDHPARATPTRIKFNKDRDFTLQNRLLPQFFCNWSFGFARAEKLEREMRRWRWNPREGAGMERE